MTLAVLPAESSAQEPAADARNGAEILLDTLIECGVDTIFGYPGGAALPLYDALYSRPALRHVLVRHEQAAVHAAEGYARSTGRVGVVLVTSGPGVANTITGLLDAMSDSIPVLCISGQVATAVIGTNAFQESDALGISRPVTKWTVPTVAELQKQLPTASPAVLEKFLRSFDRSAQIALSPGAVSGLRLYPVSDAKLIALFEHTPLSRAWTEFKKAFPGATGLARFSRVAFDTSSNQALLFMSFSPGGLGAVGKLVLLQRSASQWRIVEESQLWIS